TWYAEGFVFLSETLFFRLWRNYVPNDLPDLFGSYFILGCRGYLANSWQYHFFKTRIELELFLGSAGFYLCGDPFPVLGYLFTEQRLQRFTSDAGISNRLPIRKV